MILEKKIHKQRRLKPYNSKGKTTFSVQNTPGVYIIYQGKKLVYIGYSGTNLYKTMYRHFQSWNDKTQVRITYPDLSNITVRVVYTISANHAARLEKALISKYKPKDNPQKYESYTTTKGDKDKLDEYEFSKFLPKVEAAPF